MINATFDPTNSNTSQDSDNTESTPHRMKFTNAFTGTIARSNDSVRDEEKTDTYVTQPQESINDWESGYVQPTHSSVPPQPPENKPVKRSKKPLIGLLAMLVVAVGTGVSFYLVRQNSELRQQASSGDANRIIATVGEEKIYQKDLDLELQYFPPITEVNGRPTREYLLEKMINDSRVLQESGNKDASIYNSTDKNYETRTQKAHEVMQQKEIEFLNMTAQSSGVLITMWYQNQTLPEGMTVEQTAAEVKPKIDAIREQVSSGSLTTNAARDQIRADDAQQRIDPSADGHAFAGFQQRDGETILNNQDITNEIASLDVGGVTRVYDISRTPTEKLYAFAVIKKKNNNRSPITNLDQWLDSLEQKYPANVN